MVSYSDSIDGLEVSADGFFDGWPNGPDSPTFERLLRGSSAVVVAHTDGVVVGFITAVSDGVLSAYIPLLEVKQEHRGQGVGSALVRRMLARLDGMYMVDVNCDDDVVQFYERLGFTSSGAAMVRRNYDRQSGR